MGLTTRFGAASMDRRSRTEPSALDAVSPGVGWERMGPRTGPVSVFGAMWLKPGGRQPFDISKMAGELRPERRSAGFAG